MDKSRNKNAQFMNKSSKANEVVQGMKLTEVMNKS